MKSSILALESPDRQREVWGHLQVKTQTETPVQYLIPLLGELFPLLKDTPYVMTRAYGSVTGRKPSSKAIIYRTELSAIIVKLYVTSQGLPLFTKCAFFLS